MDLNGVIMENIDVVDITEPEAMYKLIVRLEEIYQENEEYMDVWFLYLLNTVFFSGDVTTNFVSLKLQNLLLFHSVIAGEVR